MRHDILRFRQHDEGLCGLYTIVNALSLLVPGQMTRVAGAVLVARLAEALPGDFRRVIREGTDRRQMELMLAAAELWTRDQGWPAWSWRGDHPQPGERAQAFWDRVADEIAGDRRVPLVGFGDYHRPSAYYEPHWTCVERLTPTVIHLRDSDEYRSIRRAETGIRPEHGWEIEDCFLLAIRAG